MTNRKPVCPCLGCGELNDAATSVDPSFVAGPKPGEYAICAYCHALMVFSGDLSYRLPTVPETKDFLVELDSLDGIPATVRAGIHKKNGKIEAEKAR